MTNDEEDIDWWSKFYASTGDMRKCGNYLNKGYEKITVCLTLGIVYLLVFKKI
jgi:hypothetical protein